MSDQHALRPLNLTFVNRLLGSKKKTLAEEKNFEISNKIEEVRYQHAIFTQYVANDCTIRISFRGLKK